MNNLHTLIRPPQHFTYVLNSICFELYLVNFVIIKREYIHGHQYIYFYYQILITFNKLKIMSEVAHSI